MNLVLQHDRMDCGAASLAMISSVYGKEYNLQYLRDQCFITRNGVSLLGLNEAAEQIGFETYPAQLEIKDLKNNSERFPIILHWNKNHFVVLRKIYRQLLTGRTMFELADPAHGFISVPEDKFSAKWLSDEKRGIALFLSPTDAFYENEVPFHNKIELKHMLAYLAPYKKQLGIIALLMLVSSAVLLVFPFLTEALIDRGVNGKDLNIIFIILVAQLSLYLGSITIEIFRNWIMLAVGTKLSITIISDFLQKLLRLPIRFFDSKLTGDFQQRIQDNDRVEGFLTSQSLTMFFSIITFSVFFGVLWYYDFTIMVVYLVLTLASVIWSAFWLKKRRIVDYYRFQESSETKESVYEIIRGVAEMKLNSFEDYKRKKWEAIQQKLFKTNMKSLRINQIQSSGYDFINQIKNILVTYLAATYVVGGSMTIGALLSISYIIGQMNSPVNQLLTFFKSFQDAKLSLERLNEVQDCNNEESGNLRPLPTELKAKSKGITLEKVSYQYEGPRSPKVLKDVSIHIPHGKITAIVGASGSGKTTLMKLLLKFYAPSEGIININGVDQEELSPKSIREACGVVMQDGFIFAETIARNIATSDENIDKDRLLLAAKTANIDEYINGLPMKFSTKIGATGNGISGGQQQRFLIARSVYKDPDFIMFDEATSALDAENEKVIHDNLQEFFQGKTVLLVAHRLSTVKNADQIIVLKQGNVVETGTHEELVNNQGEYYSLVKNQLELGS